MKHRTAIILLSGWILMLPPLKKYEKEKHMVRRWQAAQTDAPLVQWKHEHSYNTAAACPGLNICKMPLKELSNLRMLSKR